MSMLFRVIFVNYLLFTLFTDSYGAEEEADDFPVHYTCPSDAVFNFAAALHWISEEWKRQSPYEIGYPILCGLLITLSLIPFLWVMLEMNEPLVSQSENKQTTQQKMGHTMQQEENTNQAEDIMCDSDSEDNEEYFVPEVEPSDGVTSTFTRSRSVHKIAEQLAAVKVKRPEKCAPPAAMERNPMMDTKQGMFNAPAAEELPHVRTLNTADSFTRLKEMAEKICPESTEGRACVAVASGVLISYGVCRFLSK
ncbi:uncharacterized protein [Montipora capricornis]|uniref:uncharacterized protein n=1 Tax=Montipora capricornis TaxID=246305 RepID=UPI0035F1823A